MFASKVISMALLGRKISSAQQRTIDAIGRLYRVYGETSLQAWAARLEHATFLSLGNDGHNDITDLSPLYGYTFLNRLHVYTKHAIDLAEIRNIPNLTELGIHAGNIKNIGIMREYDHIINLDVRGSSISYVPHLAFSNIAILEIDNNTIQELECISNSTELKELYLYNNKIQTLTSAGCLPGLRKCSVGTNPLETLDGVESWKNLVDLSCGYCRIKNINAILGLKKLKKLDIRNNQIEDVECLGEMRNLSFLVMRGNPLKNITCLEKLAKLKTVSVPDEFKEYAMKLSKRMGFKVI